MSAVGTRCPLAELRHSPRFSSASVKIPNCVKFPPAIITTNILRRSNVLVLHSISISNSNSNFNSKPSCYFALTRRSTHLVKPPHSLPMSDSNSGFVNGDFAEIVVVRHGETEWNADGRLQGHLDVELNEAGKQQAALVADRLSKEPKISAVYSSDLKRALVTAETIAARCGGLEVIKDPDLRERNLGDLQGLVFREAAKLNPKAYNVFLSRRTDQEIPGGGESLDQLYHRCTSSLQRIGKKHKGERVVVVSHGGVIRALAKRADQDGKTARKVLNTSVNIFHVSDDEWTIKSWGDISHLDQTGYLKSGFGGDKTSG